MAEDRQGNGPVAWAGGRIRGAERHVWLLGAAGIAVVVGLAWATDTVTLQGERTVYTVDCEGGTWQSLRCSGRMVAGPRYRFRALKPHTEVVFWMVGASSPSGKFTDCAIADGRNWLCKPNGDAARTITLEMVHGRPMPNPSVLTKPFHAVSKWRWWLLRTGVSFGREADI